MRRHIESAGHLVDDSFTGTDSGSLASETFALGRYLLFQVTDFVLATPITSIREILSETRWEKLPGAPEQVLGCIDLRGQVLPLFHLARLIGVTSEQADGPTLVVDSDDLAVALMVDQVDAVIALEAANIGPLAEDSLPAQSFKPEAIVGVGRYQNRVIPIVDLHLAVKTLPQAFIPNKSQLPDLEQREAS